MNKERTWFGADTWKDAFERRKNDAEQWLDENADYSKFDFEKLRDIATIIDKLECNYSLRDEGNKVKIIKKVVNGKEEIISIVINIVVRDCVKAKLTEEIARRLKGFVWEYYNDEYNGIGNKYEKWVGDETYTLLSLDNFSANDCMGCLKKAVKMNYVIEQFSKGQYESKFDFIRAITKSYIPMGFGEEKIVYAERDMDNDEDFAYMNERRKAEITAKNDFIKLVIEEQKFEEAYEKFPKAFSLDERRKDDEST